MAERLCPMTSVSMISTSSSLLHQFSLEVITSIYDIQNELREFGLRFGIPVLFSSSLETPAPSDLSLTKKIVLVTPELDRTSLLDGTHSTLSQHDALIVCITDDEAEDLLKRQRIPRGLSLLVSPFAPLELYCLLQTVARSFSARQLSTEHQAQETEKRETSRQTFTSELNSDLLSSTALWIHSALTQWSHQAPSTDSTMKALLDEGYAQAALLSSYHAAHMASTRTQSEPCKIFDLLKHLRSIYALRAQYRNIDYVLHTSSKVPEILSVIKPALEALLVLIHEHLFETTSEGKIVIDISADRAQNALRIQLSDRGIYSLAQILKDEGISYLPQSIIGRVGMIRLLLGMLSAPDPLEIKDPQTSHTLLSIPFSPVQEAQWTDQLPPLQVRRERDTLAVVFLAVADRSTRDRIQAELASQGIHSVCGGTYGQILEAYRCASTVSIIVDLDNPLLDYKAIIMHGKQYGLERKLFGVSLRNQANLPAELARQFVLVGTTVKDVVEGIAQIVSEQERVVPLLSIDSRSAAVTPLQSILQQTALIPQAQAEPERKDERQESQDARPEEFELSGPGATELILCELDLNSSEVRKVIGNYVRALSHDLSELSLMIRQQKWQQLKRVAAEQAKIADTNGFPIYAQQLRNLQATAEKRDYRSATTLLFELRTLSKLMERGSLVDEHKAQSDSLSLG